MENTVSKIASQILETILSDSERLKEYSEKASLFIYDWLSDFIRYDEDDALIEECKRYLRNVRDCSAFDKMNSDFISDIRASINNTLEEKGFETSEFGYWHKGVQPLISFWEAEIRSAFRGTVLSCSCDSCCYMKGEQFLEDWDTMDNSIDCYPSSPYEAFELFSEQEGCFETKWQYVMGNVRDELERLDLTEYEDVDEALIQIEIGLFLEDFPIDYREDLEDMFEEIKQDQSESELEPELWEEE